MFIIIMLKVCYYKLYINKIFVQVTAHNKVCIVKQSVFGWVI